jgi:hypothetical protein
MPLTRTHSFEAFVWSALLRNPVFPSEKQQQVQNNSASVSAGNLGNTVYRIRSVSSETLDQEGCAATYF